LLSKNPQGASDGCSSVHSYIFYKIGVISIVLLFFIFSLLFFIFFQYSFPLIAYTLWCCSVGYLSARKVNVKNKMATKELIKLNQRHFKILDYCIAGITNREIAKKLSMSDRQVHIIVQSPSFQHELAIRRKAFEENFDERIAEVEAEVAETLRKSSSTAAKALVHGLFSPDGNLKFKSAEAILDRTGHPRVSKQISTDAKVVVNITGEDIQLLKETLEMENSNRPICTTESKEVENQVTTTNDKVKVDVCSNEKQEEV